VVRKVAQNQHHRVTEDTKATHSKASVIHGLGKDYMSDNFLHFAIR